MNLPEQHQGVDFGGVHGHRDSITLLRKKSSYTSTIPKDHPTLRPKNNWKARESGSEHGNGGKI